MTRNKTKESPPLPTPAAEAQPASTGCAAEADAADAAQAATANLQQELDASRAQNVRLLADFDNYRKRVARERSEIVKRAGEEIVAELLPVLDHFDLALQQAADPEAPFVVGIRMVYDQLVAALGKAGLAAIQAPGQRFDPAIHDAIAYQPSPEVDEGCVLLQTRCGYRMGDHVIRPATVIVSSGPPEPEADPAAEAVPEAEGVEGADAADA